MNKSQPFPMYHNIPWVLRFGIPTIGVIFGGLTTLIMWMATDDQIFSTSYVTNASLITFLIVSGSAFCSYLAPRKIMRIRHFYLLVGLMTLMVLVTCLSFSTVFFIAKPGHISNGLFVLTVLAFWLGQVYFDAIRRVKNKKLIEKNYSEKHDCFVLKRPINEFNGDVHLSLKQHFVKNWIYVFIVCWSLYEFFATNFKASLPLDLFKYWLLATFGLIPAAYAAARLVQGFYLWFYIIWKLERKTGKKFLFPEPKSLQ